MARHRDVGRIVGVIALCCFGAACTVPFRPANISYGVEDVPILAGGPLSRLSLAIRPFEDRRAQDANTSTREIPSESGVNSRKSETWDVTRDSNHRPAVAVGITQMLAKHIAATQMFRQVTVSTTSPAEADLVLTGTIRVFEGRKQSRPVAEALASQFSLVGAVTAATQDVRYEGDTDLADVKLIDVVMGAVLWQGDATGHVRGEAAVNADQAEIYRVANRSLRAAVSDLLHQLANVEPPTEELR